MKEMEKTLFNTTKTILEGAAFAFAEPFEGGNEGGDAPRRLCASVGFEGPFSGVLTIVAHEELVRLIAANMLGTEESDPEVQKKSRDALGEVLNMICGNLLTEIAGAKPEFAINAPIELDYGEYQRMFSDHYKDLAYRTKLSVEGYETETALLISGG